MHFANKNFDCGLINKVEFLSGYLNALAIIDGGINQFFSRVILLKPSQKNLYKIISDIFDKEVTFKFKNSKRIIEKPMHFFEMSLRSFILSSENENINEKEIVDKKRYISFQIIDMILFMEFEGNPILDIIQATSGSIESTFFILTFQDARLLFLFDKKY